MSNVQTNQIDEIIYEIDEAYRELEISEEFYSQTIDIGLSMPKDEQSQDQYMAMLDEAKSAVKEARDKIAYLEKERDSYLQECFDEPDSRCF